MHMTSLLIVSLVILLIIFTPLILQILFVSLAWITLITYASAALFLYAEYFVGLVIIDALNNFINYMLNKEIL